MFVMFCLFRQDKEIRNWDFYSRYAQLTNTKTFWKYIIMLEMVYMNIFLEIIIRN